LRKENDLTGKPARGERGFDWDVREGGGVQKCQTKKGFGDPGFHRRYNRETRWGEGGGAKRVKKQPKGVTYRSGGDSLPLVPVKEINMRKGSLENVLGRSITPQIVDEAEAKT